MILLCTLFLFGCDVKQEKEEKVRELEYTVVCEDRLPEKLLTEIKEKKSEAFDLTYADGNFMYLARGYGEQQTGGYSIRVSELYLSKKGIVFETELIGPGAGESAPAVISTPYVVIKMEQLEEMNVINQERESL